MFISRKLYLELFRAIDEKLQDIDLNQISKKDLSKIFKIDLESAKYVKDYYPNLLAVHRVIYSHYGPQYIVWENSCNEKFTLSCSYYYDNHSKNRWKEFKIMITKNKDGKKLAY